MIADRWTVRSVAPAEHRMADGVLVQAIPEVRTESLGDAIRIVCADCGIVDESSYAHANEHYFAWAEDHPAPVTAACYHRVAEGRTGLCSGCAA